ncbi:sugar phosphate isomerase/epimerase family protein [Humibacter ginsenosidimutans]|uniref:Sugar phosphate isomerase/epimerase n=1 Tax=Humibacter ginsenosidimutans TaxID=2599293 RepID=A0A5B8M0M4_9MICO|nr:sugar phosphate isomerase/epimerase [Humibacter ginsenosidimutans]QDZ14227.1 sugar phosphate isomerase/epimerase [Humibacter ginsenosidimutans]
MIAIGMSTSCVYPHSVESAFATAAHLGFDGIEVMVSRDPGTQDAAALLALSARHRLPVLSVHAPVLFFTQLVWGLDPLHKLERAALLARDVGAPTVVVHPPFHWQRRYARSFTTAIRSIADRTGIELAVENMFPWNIGGRRRAVYSPGWDPLTIDCDAATLDFSHAALAGRDSLELALRLGERLRHVHLCDGSRSVYEGGVLDEHLVPGDGRQPVAGVLRLLVRRGWKGSVVAEVASHGRSRAERDERLARTLSFARETLAASSRRDDSQRSDRRVR